MNNGVKINYYFTKNEEITKLQFKGIYRLLTGNDKLLAIDTIMVNNGVEDRAKLEEEFMNGYIFKTTHKLPQEFKDKYQIAFLGRYWNLKGDGKC